MKTLNFLFIALFTFGTGLAQKVDLQTSGDNSPAVIANQFSAIYGVRADAIEAILWIYKVKGYDAQRRKKATDDILKIYAQSPEKKQKVDKLSQASRLKMGIANAPKIVNALEWDLFAQTHHLSTMGHNSPAVMAKGDINIWYGISPKTLRALAAHLELNKVKLSDFEIKLADQVKKYEELKTELEAYKSRDGIYHQAQVLLEEGKLEEADMLISSDFFGSLKRQAYRGFIFGKTKELLLKYDSAAIGYKNAINNDERNSKYHLHYASNENTLAHHDEAIKHFGIALGLDSLQAGNDEYKAMSFYGIGSAWAAKEEYVRAISYYNRALEIYLALFGEKHSDVATVYNDLGKLWDSKEEFDTAIVYYNKALKIYLAKSGEQNPNVAGIYNNIGEVWRQMGKCDTAIVYYNRALKLFLAKFGEQNPNVAGIYNNLGLVWKFNGEYDTAIVYFEKALKIDRSVFGEQHPDVAIHYNNLGEAWREKGEPETALAYYNTALKINRTMWGEQHTSVATGYNNLGAVWHFKGAYDTAIVYYNKALEIDRAAFGEWHSKISADYNNLGNAWKAKGKYDTAIFYYVKVLEIDRSIFGEWHSNVAMGYNNLGTAWYSKGEPDTAIVYYNKALEIDLPIFGEQHPNISIYYNSIGALWYSKGEPDTAIVYYNRALKIYLAKYGKQHPNIATYYNNIGLAWNCIGKHDNAIGCIEKALEIDQVAFGEQHLSIARDYYSFGLIWNDKGLYDTAIVYLEKCQVIRAHFLKPDHPSQIATAKNLSHAANSRGMEFFNEKKYDQALVYYQKALHAAELAKDNILFLTSLYNIGCAYKGQRNYVQGLVQLELGLQKAGQKKLELVRKMKYLKVSCLKGLKRDKDAKDLAKQLWQEAIEANDIRLLEDLKKEGYKFGKN